jgi:hypothetical protein
MPKGHKYLTLVYQIEQRSRACYGSAAERTVASFEQFFVLIGEGLAERIQDLSARTCGGPSDR